MHESPYQLLTCPPPCRLNGTRDALTAALHIVLGDATAVDVAQVQYSAGGVRQCVCMASYGFMGDVVAVSEKLRWMGPLRWGAVCEDRLCACCIFPLVDFSIVRWQEVYSGCM